MDLMINIRTVNRGGGTEFAAEPERLRLGGKGAENVDRLCFTLPEAWRAMPVTVYVERSDGSMNLPIQLDTQGCVMVDKVFTKTVRGKWMLVATDGTYKGMTKPGAYDCYQTLSTDAEGEEITPTMYEQFVRQVIAYAKEAEDSRTQAAGSASAAAASASAAGNHAAEAAVDARAAQRDAETAAIKAGEAADHAGDAAASAQRAEESASQADSAGAAAAESASAAAGAEAAVAGHAAAAAESASAAAGDAGRAVTARTAAEAAKAAADEDLRLTKIYAQQADNYARESDDYRAEASTKAGEAAGSATAAAASASAAAGSAGAAAASAASVDVAAIIAAAKQAAKEEMTPVGAVVSCYNVPGGPDLSTAEKYAAAVKFGVWEKRGEGRAIMGADDAHAAGTTAEAGLPNITGGVWNFPQQSSSQKISTSGAFVRRTETETTGHPTYSTQSNDGFTFDASRSSRIYGASNTVQPPAMFVYIYQRIA